MTVQACSSAPEVSNEKELRADLDLFISRKGASYFICDEEGRAFLAQYFSMYEVRHVVS